MNGLIKYYVSVPEFNYPSFVCKMVDIFNQCFSTAVKSDFLVTKRIFSNIEVVGTDASFPLRFTDVSFQFEVKEGVPLAWFWLDAIEKIVENYYDDYANKPSNDAIKLLMECVLKFVTDEKNRQYLLKVKEVDSKAEIQAILAHHLFAKLSPPGEYMIDGDSFPQELIKCPACQADLNLGDTSLGNYSVWYGHPDIMIGRSTVKVEAEQEGEDSEDFEEYEYSEPAMKRFKALDEVHDVGRGGECIGADIYTTYVDEGFRALTQVFAQTITNAFYQTKQNSKLNGLCIPSFLVSDTRLRICMYNCEQDRLYLSEDMYLWNSSFDHGLDVGTIVCIWLALNFKQNKVDEDNFKDIGLEKSSFQSQLSSKILSIYQHQIQKPLSTKRRISNYPPQNVKSAFLLPLSGYAKRVLERLDTLDKRYLLK